MSCTKMCRRLLVKAVAILLLLAMPSGVRAYATDILPDAPVAAKLSSEIRPLYLEQLDVLETKRQLKPKEEQCGEHTVQRGETLILIARKYNTAVETLVKLNNLQNPHFIREGQILLVVPPTPQDVEHKLKRGETVWDLARRYQVAMDEILAANGISDPYRLVPGQTLVIPGAVPVVAASAAKVTAPVPDREVIASRSAPRIIPDLVWPLEGKITSGFGPRWGRFHYGIDIATGTGTAIRAVAAGTVVESRWRPGYGNMISIDHQNGWHSLYAHCSKLYVKGGQAVSAGQKIAAVGQTGNATGPHLHLELLYESEHKNPLKYLPR